MHINQGLLGVLLLGWVFGMSACTSLPPKAQEGAVFGVPPTERTLAQRILDRSIRNTARVNLESLDPDLVAQSRIRIDSFRSEVLLTGEVPTQAFKAQVAALVDSMPDVTEVHNRLTVAPARGASNQLHDGYLSRKVDARILSNRDLGSSQVQVITYDGIVYTLGRILPSQSQALTELVTTTVGIRAYEPLVKLVSHSGQVLSTQDSMYETQTPTPEHLQQPVATDSSAMPNHTPASDATEDNQTSPYIELHREQMP